jgi:hypothetical protein
VDPVSVGAVLLVGVLGLMLIPILRAGRARDAQPLNDERWDGLASGMGLTHRAQRLNPGLVRHFLTGHDVEVIVDVSPRAHAHPSVFRLPQGAQLRAGVAVVAGPWRAAQIMAIKPPDVGVLLHGHPLGRLVSDALLWIRREQGFTWVTLPVVPGDLAATLGHIQSLITALESAALSPWREVAEARGLRVQLDDQRRAHAQGVVDGVAVDVSVTETWETHIHAWIPPDVLPADLRVAAGQGGVSVDPVLDMTVRVGTQSPDGVRRAFRDPDRVELLLAAVLGFPGSQLLGDQALVRVPAGADPERVLSALDAATALAGCFRADPETSPP